MVEELDKKDPEIPDQGEDNKGGGTHCLQNGVERLSDQVDDTDALIFDGGNDGIQASKHEDHIPVMPPEFATSSKFIMGLPSYVPTSRRTKTINRQPFIPRPLKKGL